MARRPDLDLFAAEHSIKIVTVADIIAYRRRSEHLVERGATTTLPTEFGTVVAHAYEDVITHVAHVALVWGDIRGDEPVLVRVHSECLTGDVFGSQRCDCQAQLRKAMAMIADAGRGVLVYLRQEGRGIGLMDKLRAYALQDRGLDTVEANLSLGLPVDKRDYGIGTQILSDIGVRRMVVLTNNPRKYYGLSGFGLEVTDQIPLVIPANAHNERYLRVKQEKLGHSLDMDDAVDAI
jgi:3,4-dihydroxy 2-butanone 4-phosphate synthase/GTP cyclohydrolase II